MSIFRFRLGLIASMVGLLISIFRLFVPDLNAEPVFPLSYYSLIFPEFSSKGEAGGTVNFPQSALLLLSGGKEAAHPALGRIIMRHIVVGLRVGHRRSEERSLKSRE